MLWTDIPRLSQILPCSIFLPSLTMTSLLLLDFSITQQPSCYLDYREPSVCWFCCCSLLPVVICSISFQICQACILLLSLSLETVLFSGWSVPPHIPLCCWLYAVRVCSPPENHKTLFLHRIPIIYWWKQRFGLVCPVLRQSGWNLFFYIPPKLP